jgi:hypothetical protein
LSSAQTSSIGKPNKYVTTRKMEIQSPHLIQPFVLARNSTQVARLKFGHVGTKLYDIREIQLLQAQICQRESQNNTFRLFSLEH